MNTEIRIGLDTGGTYTDAVALDGQRQVLAAAKALTTHWDLAQGLEAALQLLLERLPPDAGARTSLVAVSTTLATNAVVENRFSPVCTILMGFDARMLERSGLGADPHAVRVGGGHDATGQELEPLDEAAIDRAVREHDARVQAFAVAALFSVRNPEHERRARERICALSDKPVTCSHELSSQLDAPKRALTAALNARLTPQIRQLLMALRQVLARATIDAPLMVVKGDGTLMRAEMALEYPVETVLSGPAASVVGAGFLSGLEDFAVSDMGGTTTDVAMVVGGRPVVRPEGAVIAGWRTMVQAVDVHTCGLGGDSEVRLDGDLRLRVGPRRAMPLSRLAHQFPQVLQMLERLCGMQHLPAFAGQFAFRNPGREPGTHLDRVERRVWDALSDMPLGVEQVARTGPGMEALRRLVDRGLVTLSAFTPSDAMHVLGQQRDWDSQAAQLGARILCLEESRANPGRVAAAEQAFCERVYQHVVRQSARLILESALAQDPGLEPRQGRWGPLGSLLDEITAGKPFSRLLVARLGLAMPLVAIGAPVTAYYPEVARRLEAQLCIPVHAAVCNAVGAVAGVVSEQREVLVNQPLLNVFRVHDPAGSRDYADAQAAIAEAKRVSRALALAAAQRAGALDPHVETSVSERAARQGDDSIYLAEARVVSRATGRPAGGSVR